VTVQFFLRGIVSVQIRKSNGTGNAGLKIIKTAGWLAVCIIGFLTTSCSFINLQRNVNELQQSMVLGGRVQPVMEHAGKSIVVAYRESPQGNEIVDYQHTDSTGHYLFMVERGHRYFVAAFLDANNNLIYDPGEPVGYFGKPTAISQSKSEDSDGANIDLSATTVLPAEFPRDLDASNITGDKNIPLVFGEITTLSDKRFSRETARQGLWAPLDFAKKNGLGIFFLEKFDPNKIPVLFIYGSGGTPLDWEVFLNSLDHDRYQPWLFYYPSGVRLGKSSRLLSEVLEYFKKEYAVKRIYVIAHSVGGLIARSYMVDNISRRQPNIVKLFISISTPWKGHPAAAQGVKNAPVVIPAWMDIQPDSEFLTSLFHINLGSRLNYYLLFSFDHEESAFGLDNDGAVTLHSELDYKAQEEAKKVFGFDDSHRQILQDEKVVRLVNEILWQTTSDADRTAKQSVSAVVD